MHPLQWECAFRALKVGTQLHIVKGLNYLIYSSELKSHIYNKMHIKHIEPDEASSVPQMFVLETVSKAHFNFTSSHIVGIFNP